MRQTHIPALAVTALAVTGVSWLVLNVFEGRGQYLPAVPWIVPLVFVVLIATILVRGWRVRSYVSGKRPGLNPFEAARTLGLARAASLGGCVLAGWYAAQVLVTLGDWGFEPRRAAGLAALVTVAFALVLSVSGLIVERWCRLSGDQDDESGPGAGGQQVEQ